MPASITDYYFKSHKSPIPGAFEVSISLCMREGQSGNMQSDNLRVLVTGGGTFLGDNIAAALLSEGAEVTLLVRPGTEDRLGPLATRTRWFLADIWDPASLRGRARGHRAVVHTVGSMVADPSRGLTHHRLNVVSARNATNMAISDGVQQLVLLSAVNAPWMARPYLRAKREAEAYAQRVGLRTAVVRAPITYVRGRPRPTFYRLLTLLASTPPFSWTSLRRTAPMPADILARGVARIALGMEAYKPLYYAPDLRRFNSRPEISGQDQTMQVYNPQENRSHHAIELLDEDTPFGWVPPDQDKRRRY